MATGFLDTMIERIRGYLDAPALNGKYSDDYLVRHVIVPSLTPVWTHVAKASEALVMVRHVVTLEEDVADYWLPPVVGELWRIAALNEDGTVIGEAMPRGLYDARGPNWRIEGRLLSFDPPPVEEREVEIWYTPSGDFKPVQTEVLRLNEDKDELTVVLTDTDTNRVGEWDRRPQAYAGQIVRLLPTSGVVEERVVESWTTEDGVTWTATVRVPFEFAAETTFDIDEEPENPLRGEFAPVAHEALWEAIAAHGALKLASYGRQTTAAHMQAIQMQLRSALGAASEHFSNVQMRTPKHFETLTPENPDRVRVWGT